MEQLLITTEELNYIKKSFDLSNYRHFFTEEHEDKLVKAFIEYVLPVIKEKRIQYSIHVKTIEGGNSLDIYDVYILFTTAFDNTMLSLYDVFNDLIHSKQIMERLKEQLEESEYPIFN